MGAAATNARGQKDEGGQSRIAVWVQGAAWCARSLRDLGGMYRHRV